MTTNPYPLDDPAYLAWMEEQDNQCGRSLTMGPAHDPYGTACDLPAGHDGPHEGPHPVAEDERLRWTGGGSCVGDPLPYHLVGED